MIISTGPLKARILTVSNQCSPSVAQYTTLESAHESAQNGDTIMVYPSEIDYSGIDISKRIFLIGNGFSSTSDMPATKIKGTINFIQGSDGAVIESFGGEFSINGTSVNNILISRNSLMSIILENSYNSLIIGNKIIGKSVNYVSNTTLTIKGTSIIQASNNIIRTYRYGSTIALEPNSVLDISNSIIILDEPYNSAAITGGKVIGKNNLIYGSISNSVVVEFNFTQIYNTNTANEFWNLFDNSYHLQPGSAAIGAGENGTDIGVFGGNSPFVENGYPNLPTIYYMNVSLFGYQNTGLPIIIKAKTNN
jgi:hypothetical protein